MLDLFPHIARHFFQNKIKMNKSSNRTISAKNKASETLAQRITGVIYATVATPYYMYHIQQAQQLRNTYEGIYIAYSAGIEKYVLLTTWHGAPMDQIPVTVRKSAPTA